ncbi:MAG TPA: 3-hydroxyacyl-CoA dehydrogenase family protein [Bacteroidales bacterium]|nr:3-hydroxyacyl-CoA dehydrogenase family protein [Bacteroidales bacterium]HPS73298.1 3-hydroxyacyl-CoA dehydrogenase family protein [Bacteroidales bacterium]
MITHVGIIGEGRMGTNLFHYISGFPYKMRWIVSPEADVDKLQRTWSKKVLRNLNTNIIDRTTADRLNRVVITTDPEALCDCGLVIEAIPEEVSLKKALFSRIDGIVPTDCILASNSSSILPSLLIPSEEKASSVIGLHFFYPVALKNLVELVVTKQTSPDVVTTAKAFLSDIGRRYFLQPEDQAFLFNRIFLEFQSAVWEMVSEGLFSARQMDQFVHQRFFPLGVFECFDAVGLDVMLPAIRHYSVDFPSGTDHDSLIKTLEAMVADGRLGVKSGRGFFDYPDETDTGDDLLRNVSPEVLSRAEEHLRTILHDAMEQFSRDLSYSREEIEAGLQEYAGM